MKRKFEKIAFVGGLLIDGTGAPAVKDSLVLVEDGKIVYAGANDRPYEGYEVRDITGKTITIRLSFSHPERTLTRDEVQAVVDGVVARLKGQGIELKK